MYKNFVDTIYQLNGSSIDAETIKRNLDEKENQLKGQEKMFLTNVEMQKEPEIKIDSIK